MSYHNTRNYTHSEQILEKEIPYNGTRHGDIDSMILGLVDGYQMYVSLGHMEGCMYGNCCAKFFFNIIGIYNGYYLIFSF